MRPLRKSFTNWQFSALSWASLVPSANSSDRSVGLGEAETDRKGDTKEHLAVYLNDKNSSKDKLLLIYFVFFIPENFIIIVQSNHCPSFFGTVGLWWELVFHYTGYILPLIRKGRYLKKNVQDKQIRAGNKR